MIDKSDLLPLIRALKANQCLLFLGAGFSAAAKNTHDEALPSGYAIAKDIWSWLSYNDEHGDYDGTSLRLLFEAARRKKGDNALYDFLDRQLSVSSYPDWYQFLPTIFWRRVYTTNVDDLVEQVYRDVAAPIDSINGITADYKDSELFLDTQQYIKLNGTLDGDLDHLTFGERQYAKRASEYGTWYDHFVREYSVQPTIFVGTQLNEPLFWQAVESRGGRHGVPREHRRRSFLVSDRISPANEDALRELNVRPVRAKAEEFFAFLREELGELPTREEVLLRVNPRFATYLSLERDSGRAKPDLQTFFRAFKQVQHQSPPSGLRSMYLLGAAPTWDDLAAGLDARRDGNDQAEAVVKAALEGERVSARLVVVTGHRGSGKSTVLMRTALSMAASGHLTLHAFGEDVPPSHVLANALDLVKTRALLTIDDAEWNARALADFVARFNKLEVPPVLLVAIRSNALHRLSETGLDHELVELGDLSDRDIGSLIGVLARENMLGVMTGQPRSSVESAFRDSARKQLLVAMREVTTGRKFDQIIAREYGEVEQQELRLTYLVACLATAEGASLTRKQLISASELPPAALLAALDRELNQLVVPAPGFDDRLVARHQVIAELIVEELSARTELGPAYVRILQVLSNDMGGRERRRGAGRRWFRLYRRLINHLAIYRRFEEDIEEARAIYEALAPVLSEDSHFWLQYGSLELEYGELDFAGHYISSAEALAPNDYFIRTAKGHLLLAQARYASSRAEASRLLEEGKELLLSLLEERDDSPYPWHILITRELDWLKIWELSAERRRDRMEQLRNFAEEAKEAFPRNRLITIARDSVERAYLETAL